MEAINKLDLLCSTCGSTLRAERVGPYNHFLLTCCYADCPEYNVTYKYLMPKIEIKPLIEEKAK